MPGNFGREFFATTIHQLQIFNQFMRQIFREKLIPGITNQVVNVSVTQDILNPTANYVIYIDDVNNLGGYNIDTDSGPTTIIQIANPNRINVEIRVSDWHTGSPTAQIGAATVSGGSEPLASDFNNRVTSKTSDNSYISFSLFVNNSGEKLWFLLQ